MQLNLDGGFAATPAGRALTPRQQTALEHIAAHQPVASDELGAHLCSWAGKHTVDHRCPWDGPNGRQVGDALKAKGLVRYRRGAGWTLPDYKPGDHLPTSQNATREGFDDRGFPETF